MHFRFISWHLAQKANAQLRLASAQRELEAEDLAAAALVTKGAAGDANVAADEGSVALHRVKISGSFQVVKTKIETCLQETQDKWEELKKKIAKDFADGLASNLNTAQTELKNNFDDVGSKAGTLLDDLSAAEVFVGKSSVLADMQDQKKGIDNKLKEFQSKCLAKFNRAVASLNKVMVSVRRKENLVSLASKVVKTSEAPPPLFAVGKALIGLGEINKSNSSFEAKCGVRSAVVAAGAGDPCDAICSMAKTKRALKDVSKHLQSNKTGSSPVTDQPTVKRIMKELKRSFDPCLFSTLALPADQEWTHKIYGPTFFGFAKGYTSINMNPMCVMDCRLVLEGEEILIGLPLNRNPPMSIREIRKAVNLMTVDELVRFVHESAGWAVHHDSSHIAIVPTGYLVIQIASEECLGLRCGCASDESDTVRVKSSLDTLISEFPEVGNSSTGYSQWKSWLDTL